MQKNGGQKRIPRADTNPKSVKIKTAEGFKSVKVPDDVPVGKAEAFQEYAQYKWDYDHAEYKTFKTKGGKAYPLPAMNKKIILKLLGPDEVEEFNRKDKLARSGAAKIMKLKAKVYGDMSQRDSRSLFDEYADEILALLGRGYSAGEVHATMLKKGVAIKYETIMDFHKRNREKVSEMRNAYDSDINDISLSNKRSRLEKLNYLYHEIGEDFERSTTPTLRSNLSRELRGIIEQAKKEVEGENLKLTVEGNIDVNASLTAMVDSNRVLYGLTVNQIVIARVAARLRLPSQYFIDRLAHSYYAKYNGYRSNDDLATKPLYPTSVQYDILSDEMEAKHKQYEEKLAGYKIDEVPEVDEQVQAEQDEQKEEIKRKLRAMLKMD